MTFAVFAVHAFANSTGAVSEFCRTGSKEVAEALVDKLKKERIRVMGKTAKRELCADILSSKRGRYHDKI